MKITGVAIIYKGILYSLDAPARHDEVIYKIHEETGDLDVYGTQGFMADDGKFYNRFQARIIAQKAGQIIKPVYGELYSENLW